MSNVENVDCESVKRRIEWDVKNDRDGENVYIYVWMCPFHSPPPPPLATPVTCVLGVAAL